MNADKGRPGPQWKTLRELCEELAVSRFRLGKLLEARPELARHEESAHKIFYREDQVRDAWERSQAEPAPTTKKKDPKASAALAKKGGGVLHPAPEQPGAGNSKPPAAPAQTDLQSECIRAVRRARRAYLTAIKAEADAAEQRGAVALQLELLKHYVASIEAR